MPSRPRRIDSFWERLFFSLSSPMPISSATIFMTSSPRFLRWAFTPALICPRFISDAIVLMTGMNWASRRWSIRACCLSTYCCGRLFSSLAPIGDFAHSCVSLLTLPIRSVTVPIMDVKMGATSEPTLFVNPASVLLKSSQVSSSFLSVSICPALMTVPSSWARRAASPNPRPRSSMTGISSPADRPKIWVTIAVFCRPSGIRAIRIAICSNAWSGGVPGPISTPRALKALAMSDVGVVRSSIRFASCCMPVANCCCETSLRLSRSEYSWSVVVLMPVRWLRMSMPAAASDADFAIMPRVATVATAAPTMMPAALPTPIMAVELPISPPVMDSTVFSNLAKDPRSPSKACEAWPPCLVSPSTAFSASLVPLLSNSAETPNLTSPMFPLSAMLASPLSDARGGRLFRRRFALVVQDPPLVFDDVHPV
ncbi:MAG: hypothetical protein EBR62_03570 [Verrucomicrobia bacterium]|nr:hypothetical protein [Verrucomicrobiota bacterium]